MPTAPQLIRVTVRDPQGKGIPGARVYFTAGPVALPDIAGVADSQGNFTLAAPTPGNYTIGSAAEGFSAAESTVAVKPGETAAVEITLRP
jgi:hypothetical protein